MNSVEALSNVAFTTSGALVDTVDKKVLVVLRDGRKLMGMFRSYDQYANFVLCDTIEQIYHPESQTIAERQVGVYLVRGENVALLGEIDLELEDEPPRRLNQAPIHTLLPVVKEEANRRQTLKEKRDKILLDQRGFSAELGEDQKY
ncbi:hypothetical protein E5Q_00217 [Mixia osmundae IAM 14324]|uniref:U6 snRNA-associated Sm-like protein LSm1 n=1 Tax=Mixia osmundae (strain CBS 9802 / IAM 14324 / JCM 22182 / KY 12970) TaxID=764103 RepID=G7DSL3_MIXOS|nr:hypothetical protein E5Q_00217 [Mixia osmundae IAM 14324]